MKGPYSRYSSVGCFINLALKRLDEFGDYFKRIGDDGGLDISSFARKQIYEMKENYSSIKQSTGGRMLILLDKVLKDYLHLQRPITQLDKILLKLLPNQKNKEISDAMVYIMIPENVATDVEINMQMVAAMFHGARLAEEEGMLEEFLHPELAFERRINRIYNSLGKCLLE
jgi:hypothetical protein